VFIKQFIDTGRLNPALLDAPGVYFPGENRFLGINKAEYHARGNPGGT
jgi:hypothetical protein